MNFDQKIEIIIDYRINQLFISNILINAFHQSTDYVLSIFICGSLCYLFN